MEFPNGLRILLAVDGSDQSTASAVYLSQLLDPEWTAVHILHVFSKIPDSYWDLARDPAFAKTTLKAYSWESAQRKKAMEVVGWTRHIFDVAGFPAGRITSDVHELVRGVARDIADESDKGYDAVVLGSRGAGRIQDLVFGSTCAKLIKMVSQLPICLVGHSPSTKGILLAMDSSEDAAEAAALVPRLARGRSWPIVIFNAFRALPSQPWMTLPPEDLTSMEKTLAQEWENIVRPILDHTARDLKERGVEQERIRLKTAVNVRSRSGAIIQQAEECGLGTIVMGRCGVSRVEDYYIGRVTAKVLQMARDKAVWIVP